MIPVQVTISGVLAGRKVVAVSAGTSHSLALCDDGALVAWGYNSRGQLGNGTAVTATVPILVNMSGVLAGKVVAGISAGASCS